MKARKLHVVLFSMVYFATQATYPGLSVILKNRTTSCEDLKVKENYVYNFEGGWTKDELQEEEWRKIPQHTVLARIVHHNNTVKYITKDIVRISTGFLETTQCLNLTLQVFRKKGKEILVNFIASDSRTEINGNALVSSKHDVSSRTPWIILGSIVGSFVLLIIALIVWKMGYFRWCRRNHQDRREQTVNQVLDQDQSQDQEDDAESM